MKHLGDITKIDWSQVEPVDVVTGGSPCQDLSVAGKRAGLAGERSGLYMEQIRCVKELRQADVLRGRTGVAIRPRFMVWENVPGAFSSGNPKGSDFAAVIEELIKIAEPDASVCIVPPSNGWTKSGCYYADDGRWSIAWRVHDAQFWGVPQRRKRIALVADFGGLAAPEVLFERKGLSGDFEQGAAQGQGVAGGFGKGPEGAIGVDLYNQTTTGTVAKSLNSAATDADHVPCVMNNQSAFCQEPIPINMMLATRDKALGRGTGFGVGEAGEAQFTISAAHSHAVCAGFKAGQSMAGGIGYQDEIAATLSSKMSGTEPSVVNARVNAGGNPCVSK